MPSVRRTAVSAAAAVLVWIAAVVLALAVGSRPAGAQSGFSLDATCTYDEANTAFDLTFTWTSSETGNVTFAVSVANPDGSTANLHRATGVSAAGSTQAIDDDTTIQDGGVVTWTWTHSSGTQTGTVTCTVPSTPATLDGVVDALETLDTKLDAVRTVLGMVENNTDGIEDTLDEVETHLATINMTLPAIGAVMIEIRDEARHQSSQNERDGLMLASVNYRLKEHEALVNQARNQTHALLALVAITFAMWLRRIFRSRKEAT